MEKRQVELAVKMLDLLKDDGAEEEDDFSNTFYKKKVYSAFNNEDSVIGLVQKLAIKKMAEKGEQVGSKYDEDLVEKLVEDRVRASMMEYKLKQSNAKDISEQLENFKLSFIKQLKEEMLEGELIKRQTEEDLEREKLREV